MGFFASHRVFVLAGFGPYFLNCFPRHAPHGNYVFALPIRFAQSSSTPAYTDCLQLVKSFCVREGDDAPLDLLHSMLPAAELVYAVEERQRAKVAGYHGDSRANCFEPGV